MRPEPPARPRSAYARRARASASSAPSEMTLTVHGYDIRERLGEGASAEVYAAIRRATRASVALKVARASSAPEMHVRFEREAEILARLRSPFVCALVEMARANDGRPVLVLERLVGETLAATLEREKSLGIDEVVRILDHALQALVVAHAAGVVHRDLAPGNLFMHRTPDGARRTKLLDFGVSKDAAPAGVFVSTHKGTVIGTMAYAAPEQLAAEATDRITGAADLYALGVIALEALAGRPVWGRLRGPALLATKREHAPPTLDELTGETWPRALVDLLAGWTALDFAERPRSAEAALTALRAVGERLSFKRAAAPAADLHTTTTMKPRGPRSR